MVQIKQNNLKLAYNSIELETEHNSIMQNRIQLSKIQQNNTE